MLLAGTVLLWTSAVSLADPRDQDGFGSRDSDRGNDSEGRFHLEHDSLVVSSSTYDRTRGALAFLTIGTTLPNSATATTKAVAGNNYVSVWNNASVDPSFGVTSPIRLTDIDPFSGRVFHGLGVPTDEVVTSFSSKSELGLHFVKDWRRSRIVFVACAGAGIGAIDVSNSDAVAGQDPTNPVTFAFGPDHAFARTIVSVNEDGRIVYTPTIAYGGNNGRSALLGSNGLYYAVGNANNGNPATFGPSNGTNPDVTETTGLESSSRSMRSLRGWQSPPATRPRSTHCSCSLSALGPTSRARTTITAA